MSKMIEMKIRGILESIGGSLLFLEKKAEETNEVIHMGIDFIAARSIEVILRGENTSRPLTHELFEKALGAFGVKVDRIEITHIKNEAFIGDLVFTTEEGMEVHLDSRPSDGIAMALRFGAKILFAKEIFDKYGKPLPKEVEDLLSKSYNPKSKKDH